MSTTNVETMQAPQTSGGSRRTFLKAVTVGVMLFSGLGVMHGLEDALALTFEKPYLPLAKPFTTLPRKFGTRYVADKPDERLEPAVVEQLGTKEYLLREYRDTTKKPGEVGSTLELNLNYYGTGSATPHVPEVCWAGEGLVESSQSRQQFEVAGVPHEDGHVDTLRMRMICFIPQMTDQFGLASVETDPKKLLNVAYLFQVDGKYVATPQEVTGEFWDARNKYAYHTKVEVTVPQYCTPAEAQVVVSDFLRASLADIETCLPHPGGMVGTASHGSGDRARPAAALQQGKR